MNEQTPVIDLTNLSETSESSAEISVIDLTEDDVEDFVLSIDIGLVNMGLCSSW